MLLSSVTRRPTSNLQLKFDHVSWITSLRCSLQWHNLIPTDSDVDFYAAIQIQNLQRQRCERLIPDSFIACDLPYGVANNT